MEEAIRIAFQEEYSHKQTGTPRKEEYRSNDAVAPAVTQPDDTGAYSEPEPMDLSSIESLSSGRRQPVNPMSGDAHVQMDVAVVPTSGDHKPRATQ
ncbi:hypothetical protein PInf_008614 [Phytophthora infestans]|nr:hypothetical protein PInf_008614 [Phytophthora infestans]